MPPLYDQIRSREIRVEEIPEMDVLYTRKRMTDYNNTEISVNRWFELFKVAEKRGLPVSGSIILAYHTENPMEQFFKSTCELECMLPVKKDEREFFDMKPFGGFNAATALHIGEYETISTTHLKLLKWIEAQGLKLGGKICEEYIISPVDLNTSTGYVTKIIAPLAP
jgi:effector-binding domain-containing protein